MLLPVISTDLDEVQFEYSRQFFLWHNHTYGTNFDFIRHPPRRSLHDLIDCSEEEFKERMRRYEESDFHLHAAPIPGALETVYELRDRARFPIVTSRTEHGRIPIIRLLQRHRAEHLFPSIHFGRDKAARCKALGSILHIDDHPIHARRITEAGIPVLVPLRPWNDSMPKEHGRHVCCWEEIKHIILTECM